MPKRVNFQPNIRVDLSDLDHSTHGFSQEVLAQALNILVDKYPRIVSGFRIEIADQSEFPGLLTIHNGLSIDKSGAIISNTIEENTQRSITLSTDGTFYIEVQFSTTLADTDDRAYWDPDYDNGLDPSGDERPDGREFSMPVATRAVHDWSIVSPPSTTGFAVSSDPSSLRVPLAVLTVSGGEITGVSTQSFRSTLIEPAAAGSSVLRSSNTNLFPDTFTLILDEGGASEETVVVSSNDRTNGILTLSSITLNSHSVGTIMSNGDTTPPQFLVSRSSHIPVVGDSVGDARPSFFQGNEESGFAYSKNPYTGGNSDSQVESLKAYVDFLAGQLRELKFGASRAEDLGVTAPSFSFSSPRYFDRSGGLVGARTNTVSVGDGSSSWGDFNVAQAGSAQAALQAAHDALPAGGGIIYVKAGTYDIVDTTVSITKPVVLLGDGRDVTFIRATGTVPALSVNTSAGFSWGGVFRLENLSVSISGATETYALSYSGLSRTIAKNCYFNGVESVGTQVYESSFEDCTFAALTGSEHCLSGIFKKTRFVGCVFTSNSDVVSSRCVNLQNSTEVEFSNCTFFVLDTPTAVCEFDSDCSYVVFSQCFCELTTTADASFWTFEEGGLAAHDFTLKDSILVISKGIGSVFVDHLLVTNCSVTYGLASLSHTGVSLTGSAVIDSCRFTQSTSDSAATGVGVYIEGSQPVTVANTVFDDCDYSIQVVAVGSIVNISDCSTNGGRSGIVLEGTSGRFFITGCDLRNLVDDSEGVCYGIVSPGGTSLTGSKISNNHIQTIGAGTAATVGGIYLNISEVGSSSDHIEVTNNTISTISASISATAYGIFLNSAKHSVVANNVLDTISPGSLTATFYGLRINFPLDTSITGNVLTGLGSSSGDKGSSACIMVGNSGTTDAYGGITIADNRIFGKSSTTSISAINILDGIKSFTVTGNSIELTGGGSGIKISSDAVLDGDVVLGSVQGNVIYSCTYGIHVSMVAPAATEGKLVISNNSVLEFSATGIHITGSSVNQTDLKNIVVTGNSLSSTTGLLGINLTYNNKFICSNNVIDIVNAGSAVNGIFTFNSTGGAVNGNLVTTISASGDGIRLAGSNDLTCSGNMVEVDTSGNGIFMDGFIYVTGNYVNNNGAGAAIFDNSGGQASTSAYDNEDNGTVQSLVGLNKRTA